MINAAPRTFLHEGRIADIRCTLHRGLLWGANAPFPHATTRKMYETAARLYEQKGHRTKPTPLGQYLTRWNAWFRSGLSGIELRGAFLPALAYGNARSV
jgi:hypothetical protein